MLETKSMQVATSEEQNTIDLMQNFGWTCLSSQEINSKESHLENRGGDIYSVTTSENYVKLIFQRDTNHKYYNELVNCENTYNSILHSKPTAPSFRLLMAIVGLLFWILPGVLYIVYYCVKKSKYNKAYADWQNKWHNEAIPALNKARQLA